MGIKLGPVLLLQLELLWLLLILHGTTSPLEHNWSRLKFSVTKFATDWLRKMRVELYEHQIGTYHTITVAIIVVTIDLTWRY